MLRLKRPALERPGLGKMRKAKDKVSKVDNDKVMKAEEKVNRFRRRRKQSLMSKSRRLSMSQKTKIVKCSDSKVVF